MGTADFDPQNIQVRFGWDLLFDTTKVRKRKKS